MFNEIIPENRYEEVQVGPEVRKEAVEWER
jgi:hypothetical protein